MLPDVSQGFLGDPKQHDLNFVGEPPFAAKHAEGGGDARVLGDIGRQPLQGGDQPQVVQHGRSQVLAQAPHVLHYPAGLFMQCFQTLLGLLGKSLDCARQVVDPLAVRHQGLYRVVVKLEGDALALFLLDPRYLLQQELHVLLHLLLLGHIPSDMLDGSRTAVAEHQAAGQPHDDLGAALLDQPDLAGSTRVLSFQQAFLGVFGDLQTVA